MNGVMYAAPRMSARAFPATMSHEVQGHCSLDRSLGNRSLGDYRSGSSNSIKQNEVESDGQNDHPGVAEPPARTTGITSVCSARGAGDWARRNDPPSRVSTTTSVRGLALVGCAPTDVIPETAEPSTTPPSSVATVDGSFEVEAGQIPALACVGEGSPTVIYDAGTGTSGIATLSRASQVSAEVQALSSRTRVCSFDRAWHRAE